MASSLPSSSTSTSSSMKDPPPNNSKGSLPFSSSSASTAAAVETYPNNKNTNSNNLFTPSPPSLSSPSTTNLYNKPSGGGSGIVRTLSRSLMKRSASVHKFISFPAWPVSIIPRWLDGPYGCGITRLRHILFLTLTETDSKAGLFWAGLMIITITLSIVSFCIASMPEYRIRAARNIHGTQEDIFAIIETVCITIFTFEYFGRLICITAIPNKDELENINKHGFHKIAPRITITINNNNNDNNNSNSNTSHSSSTKSSTAITSKASPRTTNNNQHRGPLGYPRTLPQFKKWSLVNFHKLLAFILSPLNIIDVIAIVPYFVDLSHKKEESNSGSSSLTILRVLRLARVLRLFKLSKRMQGWQLMAKTISKVTDALAFLVFFIVLAMVLFGSIIFFCEGGEWDEVTETFLRPTILGNKLEATPFQSIPHSFWWTMVTMVTLGYGDFVPTTDWGRLFGAILMLLSILVLAMPITVIGNSFSAEYNIAKRQKAAAHAATLAAAMKEKQQLSTHKSFQLSGTSNSNFNTNNNLFLNNGSTGNTKGNGSNFYINNNYSNAQYSPGSNNRQGIASSSTELHQQHQSGRSSGKPRRTNSNRQMPPMEKFDEQNTLHAKEREQKGLYETGIAGTTLEASFITETEMETIRNQSMDAEMEKYNDAPETATPYSEYTSTNGDDDDDDDEDDAEEDYEFNQFSNLASAADIAIMRTELFQLRSDMIYVKNALDHIIRNQQRMGGGGVPMFSSSASGQRNGTTTSNSNNTTNGSSLSNNNGGGGNPISDHSSSLTKNGSFQQDKPSVNTGNNNLRYSSNGNNSSSSTSRNTNSNNSGFTTPILTGGGLGLDNHQHQSRFLLEENTGITLENDNSSTNDDGEDGSKVFTLYSSSSSSSSSSVSSPSSSSIITASPAPVTPTVLVQTPSLLGTTTTTQTTNTNTLNTILLPGTVDT